MSDYYNRQGRPCTYEEWAADRSNRRVALWEDDAAGVKVSTVWMGLDHRFGEGPPLIFETMIFGGPHDEDCWRYSTEEEALIGHEEAVRLAQEAS